MNHLEITQLVKEIIECSSMISERVMDHYCSNITEQDQKTVLKNLEHWRSIISQSDQWDEFYRFLSWEDIDLESANKAVGPVKLKSDLIKPEWALLLEQVFIVYAMGEQINKKFKDPFESFLSPFVFTFRKILIEKSGIHIRLFTEEAIDSLEESLFKKLHAEAANVFLFEFNLYRSTDPEAILNQCCTLDDIIQKQKFIKKIQKNGVQNFFLKYPVLARKISTTTLLWINDQLDFINRLSIDLTELISFFNLKKPVGKITKLKSQISDLPINERTTLIVFFESGEGVLYKSRNLSAEYSYNKFLRWINRSDSLLKLKTIAVLNRNTYGWVEKIDHKLCTSEEESHRFYFRLGSILCILYMLRGNDCQSKNIIACGEHPVIIDNENIMHPYVVPDKPFEDFLDAEFLAIQILEDSVLNIGMLPYWTRQNDYQLDDISGIGHYPEKESLHHLPFVENYPQRLKYFIEDIISGFQKTYHFAFTHKDLILSGPIMIFKEQMVRFLFRSRQYYQKAIYHASQSQYLMNGADYSIQLEILARLFVSESDKPSFWPILKYERESICQNVFPYFSAKVNDHSLFLSDMGKTDAQKIDKYFFYPSYSMVIDRIQKMNEDDLCQQIDFIKSALMLRMGKNFPKFSKTLCSNDQPAQKGIAKLEKQAAAIGITIKTKAIISNKSSTWITPVSLTGDDHHFILKPAGFDCKSGIPGISLFLASLYKAFNDDEAKSLCLKSIYPFLKYLKMTNLKRKKEDIDIFSTQGLTIFILSRISRYLNTSSIEKETYEIINSLQDEIYDFDNDTGATLLGLLFLYKDHAQTKLLQKALQLGGRLSLSTDLKFIKNHVSYRWNISLISLFLKLYTITKERYFLTSAEKIIKYEIAATAEFEKFISTSFFLSEHNLYHFYEYLNLCLLSVCGLFPKQEYSWGCKRLNELIPIIINMLDENSISDVMCYGKMMLIDFLQSLGMVLNQQNLIQDAIKYACELVDNAKINSGYSMSSNLSHSVFIPGLFNGISGIGYELLRLSKPDLFPSMLFWRSENLGILP
ncbi:MAG: DUF4135 domain-containing protein [Desulfobacterales bacterium]|nr:DUF4135 domain-containing protein [Desulfobacterales bacterium]